MTLTAHKTVTMSMRYIYTEDDPVPKTEAVRVTFACPVGLKADLDRYATLHAQTYGEAVDTITLIPHMLEAFMVRDRAFKKSMQN